MADNLPGGKTVYEVISKKDFENSIFFTNFAKQCGKYLHTIIGGGITNVAKKLCEGATIVSNHQIFGLVPPAGGAGFFNFA